MRREENTSPSWVWLYILNKTERRDGEILV